MASSFIDAQKYLREHYTINVEVRNIKRVKMRLWMASRFIRFGAWIAGTGLKWNEEVGVIFRNDQRLLDD